jgi:hypothetical protein
MMVAFCSDGLLNDRPSEKSDSEMDKPQYDFDSAV